MIHRRLTLALPLLAVLTGCATPNKPVAIGDTLARDPQLSILASLVDKAGLAATLNGPGPLTVFAPTNEAFKAVPQKTLDELARDPARLKAVLTYHVLPARVMSAEVKVGNARTVEGGNLALGKAGTFVTVEEAMVQAADIVAINGVVHTIDRVLLPPARR